MAGPKSTTLAQQIARIGHGDHLCLVARQARRALAVAGLYVRQGLARNDRCVYLLGGRPADLVRRALREAGVDVDRAGERGTLLLVGVSQYAPSGDIDIERTVRRLQRMERSALDRGFAGVRIVSDADPDLVADLPVERLIAWEERLTEWIEESGRASALCTYHVQRLAADVVDGGLRTHPLVAVDHRLFPNPYYEPPAVARAPDADRRRIDWRLEQIGRFWADERIQETARTLESVVRASPLAMYIVDHTGMVQMWSPAAERMVSCTAADALGRPPPQVPEEQWRQFEELLGRVLSGQTFTGVEVRRQRTDGTWLDASLSMAPLRDANGRIYGAVGFLEEIGARKEAEREREQRLAQERRARAAAEEAASVERAIRRAAEAIASVFTPQEVARAIAETALDATPADGAYIERGQPDDASVEVTATAGRLAPAPGQRLPYARSLTGAVQQGERALTVPRLSASPWTLPEDLADRCADCAAVAMRLNDPGGRDGALIIVRHPEHGGFDADEIDRVRTFATLAGIGYRKIHLLRAAERRRDELQRVMRSRTRLMRGFSHDVKNPLGVADGYLQILGLDPAGTLTDEQRDSIAKSRRAIEDALALIEDLVEFSRAEAGAIRLELRPIDLRRLVRGVGEEYRPQADENGLFLTVDVPDAFPSVRTDGRRVSQIMGNLVSNAIKYTVEGGITLHLDACPADGRMDDGEWACIHVADTGPGIPEDRRDALFQEFTRLERPAERGAGLGLAISRHLARALGGDITVASEVGRGSTFTLRLPVRPR